MKKYLNIFLLPLFTVFFSLNLYAKVNVSPLFINLSDAMTHVKKGEITQATPYLTALSHEFQAIPTHNSTAGKQVEISLSTVIQTPNMDNLTQLSKALYAFEKEQNPIDYTQQRQKFAKRVMPVYHTLAQAVKMQDLDAIKTAYKRFNTIWTVNEQIVRSTSLGHYGQVESAMTFMRVAMVAEPTHFEEIQHQLNKLAQALNEFNTGKSLQVQAASTNGAPTNLAAGIKLLEKSYHAFEHNNLSQGKADISLFVQRWTIFEGEVSTRDGHLYTKVENELPIIMAKGNQPQNMQRFKVLIHDLNQLNITGSYSLFDAMIILLREGIEALLIIMALLTSLTATKQPRTKKWIYTGAGLGVIASLIGAVALQQLFPALSSGTNREILEGGVGIIAVVMMIFVGAWLHSKSSIQGWKRFIDKQVTQALATGSLVSMLSLSFLSVFREGAETVLFYAGMMPLIALKDLLLGIILALILLAIIALIINKTSAKLPIHQLFKLMTWLIYILGFKILGVSIHALQLTKILPIHLIDGFPAYSFIGIYPTWETWISQCIYIGVVFMVARLFKHT